MDANLEKMQPVKAMEGLRMVKEIEALIMTRAWKMMRKMTTPQSPCDID